MFSSISRVESHLTNSLAHPIISCQYCPLFYLFFNDEMTPSQRKRRKEREKEREWKIFLLHYSRKECHFISVRIWNVRFAWYEKCKRFFTSKITRDLKNEMERTIHGIYSRKSYVFKFYIFSGLHFKSGKNQDGLVMFKIYLKLV